MYAVIETGGKQYLVSEGETLRVEKLEIEPGTEFQLDKVLMAYIDNNYLIGSPYLENVRVNAIIKEHGRGKKLLMMKKKRKKGYKKKIGHRQPYTEIEIKSISLIN